MRTRYVGDIAVLGAPQKALPKSEHVQHRPAIAALSTRGASLTARLSPFYS
jgi:hypothetical protein